MYWWKMKPLADELKEGQVSQINQFRYYLGTSLMTFMSMFGNRYGGSSQPSTQTGQEVSLSGNAMEGADLVAQQSDASIVGLIQFGSVLSQVLILVLGLWICYCANKRSEGKFFIERFVCLGFPALIRVFVIAFCVGFLNAVLGLEAIEHYVILALEPITSILYFVFVYSSLKYINKDFQV